MLMLAAGLFGAVLLGSAFELTDLSAEDDETDPDGDALDEFTEVSSQGNLLDLIGNDGAPDATAMAQGAAPAPAAEATPGEGIPGGPQGNEGLGPGNARELAHRGGDDDRVTGGRGDDYLFGGDGEDTLVGRGGSDWLHGEDGSDLLIGGTGDDMLWGGEGDDLLQGEAGRDWLVGGGGADWLAGGDGDDALQGGEDNDTLLGGDGADTLQGGNGDDWLDGGDDGDLVLRDYLNGGPGDDTLMLDADDYATGGEGADIFAFAPNPDGPAPMVADFDPAEDQLVLTYDASLGEAPQIAVVPDPSGTGNMIVFADGCAVAVIKGGGVTAEMIQLQPAEALAA